jgi:hypothetical protein
VVTKTILGALLILLCFVSQLAAQSSGRILFDSKNLEPTVLRVGFAISAGLNPYSQRSVDQFWTHAETDFRSSVLTSVLITSFGNIEHSMRTLSEFAIYDGPLDPLVVVDSVGIQPFTILRVGFSNNSSGAKAEQPSLTSDDLSLNRLITHSNTSLLDSLASNLSQMELEALLPSEHDIEQQLNMGKYLVDSLSTNISMDIPCNTRLDIRIGTEPIVYENCWYVRGQAIYSRHDPQKSYIMARQDALSRLSMFLGNRVQSFVMVLNERSISTDYQVSSIILTDISVSHIQITESLVDVIVAVPIQSIIPIN